MQAFIKKISYSKIMVQPSTPIREDEQSEPINELIARGAEIAGGAAGGAIGFLVAGPAGAIAGGASGPLISYALCKAAKEIKTHFLGKREEVRIGAVCTFAANKIQENLSVGRQVRGDGFFQEKIGERSTAEEIIEGVFLAAQREHEEKKLQFYSNLVANIAFDDNIDKSQANLLIKIGMQISYRQMCILTVFANKHKYKMREENYRNGKIKASDFKKLMLFQEILDLYRQGMLIYPNEFLFGLTDVAPAKLEVQGTGVLLYNLMELGRVSSEDTTPIVQLLQ